MKYGFVKVGAFTPQVKVAEVNFNVTQIIDGINCAKEQGVEVLVFPELSVTGATCGDLFYTDVLIDSAANGLKKIAAATENTDMLVFVGLPLKHNGLIYNAAAALNNGKVLGFIPKTAPLGYGEYSDSRYFAELRCDTEVAFCGLKVPFGNKILFKENSNEKFTVATEIGTDLWLPVSPSTNHALNGAEIIVNPSFTAETVGRAEYRRKIIESHTAKLACGYITASAGAGESTTDCVYAGHNVIAENGKILKESALFDTGLTVSEIDLSFIDFERGKVFKSYVAKEEYTIIPFTAKSDAALTRVYEKTPFVPNVNELGGRAELILDMQAEGLKKRIEHARANCSVLGLSGGLDSTLAILVAVTAMKKLNRPFKDVIAVTMPCFGTTSRTYQNTLKLAKALGVTLKKVDITKSVTRHLKDIGHDVDTLDVTFENAQARERTQVIMDIANMNNGLVVGTGDLSELALGWATYNGDHMSMYGVNASVPKTLVRHIVSHYAAKSKGKLKAVLKDILDTPVSPELLPAENGEISQKTEDIVGPYILHDFFLYYFIRNGFSPQKIYYIAKYTFNGDFKDETILKWLKTFFRRFFIQQFKRSCVPDGVKVGSVALSPRGDWKMPSDASFELWLENLK